MAMAKRGIWILVCSILLAMGATQCGSADLPVTSPAAGTPLSLLLPTGTLTPTPTVPPVHSATPLPTESPTHTQTVPPSTNTPEPTEATSAVPPTQALPTEGAPPTQTPPSQALPTQAPPSGALPTEGAPLPPTATAQPPQPTAMPSATSRPPLAAQQGGEWDMEAGFAPGVSPLGETCPGWAVAHGWQAFVAPGDPASSCLNENKNPDNVHSGQRSQELTFDFIHAEAGILRQAQTVPGHRYRIEAWGKHIRSASPVELFLGLDPTGGQNWQAGSVTWHPWDETQEDAWVHTQVVVQAQAEALTLFLKGYHPLAVQGGATLFDDVRVIDLGP